MNTKLVLLSLLMLISSRCWAEDYIQHYAKRFDHKQMRSDLTEVYGQMDLSEEQQTELEQSRAIYHDEIKKMARRIRELRRELREELAKDNLDEAKIENLKSELQNLQAEMTDMRVNGLMQVREILSKEQYEKLQEAVEDTDQEQE